MTLCVQYGCGFHAPAGWENFDASPTLRFERLPVIGLLYTKNEIKFPASVRYGDIAKGLPVPAESVDKLYASHVLEHLSYENARRAIANSFLLLKPGGVFRLIVPDLRARIDRYAIQHGNADAAPEFLDSTLLGQRRRPSGIMQIASSIFGGSEHRWMWDEASLTADLQQAGFISIRRCVFGDSNDRDFDQVEIQERFIDGEIVELAMQCCRPHQDR